MIVLSKACAISKEGKKLSETEDMDGATHILIVSNQYKKLRGCNFNEGELYEIGRRYGNDIFSNGDIYIMDEDGIEFSGWGVIDTAFYK
ncbi:hypothetical protein [Paenibacillus donghaensis]|uniref:Uncharacterized protein n=1 Tax=Paenibacillus donghaensis TaxID=414771 RepID=A0A2Z2KAT0_9BACL|nr:hypothetical protein [Paenibacillus donghaensis]ASA22607.1 hypothetical protein B9T62_18545 [Paenibacillus donghaensis]